ncbi:MAG: ornithine--oxo-acid transaminase [Armatimonadetes bacterium]|nr:ornithine--oxo-acid transaminase [Armatimonadota bacterium]
MSSDECIKVTEQFGAHNYHPLAVTLVEGDGSWVWDADGNKYLDCVGSYSAMAHGHRSKSVIDAAREQLDHLTLTSRAVYTRELALFLKALCEYSELDMACPMNSGAEAIETCIKLARKWGYTVKGIPEGKAEIIVANENFHGRTTTIIGFSSEAQYRSGFGPFTPGFISVPFGDIEALRRAITPNTAAIMMEPIQAEAGILFPPDGYMAAVRKECTAQNVLLVWDEIQTGFCRTGKKFAWMHEDAKPDLMAVGKALGGGLFPVSAAIGTKEVVSVFHPGDHGSTFGGNPLGCAIAIMAMAEMEANDLAAKSEVAGKLLLDGFSAIGHPSILEIRGRGLLVGLEFKEGTDTQKLVGNFLKEGIITKETRHRTFRFAPPLTTSREEIDEIVSRTRRAIEAL